MDLKYKTEIINNRDHDLESFEWVILFAIYKHSIERALNGPEAAKERLPTLMEEFKNIFPDVGPPALADKRIILLDPAVDHFQNIQGLLAFVEDVVGSNELCGVLTDIWLDLLYRKLALTCRHYNQSPPPRPGSIFENKAWPALIPPECLHHQDLIRCLEALIPHQCQPRQIIFRL